MALPSPKEFKIKEEDTDLDLINRRLTKIPIITPSKNLVRICLRQNSIEHIELEPFFYDDGDKQELRFPNLVNLDLYLNEIIRIRAFSQTLHQQNPFSNLTNLDLSYNSIKKIEGLEGLVKLETLYLTCNKISKLDSLSSLTNLTSLDLGSNRLRNIDPNVFNPLTKLTSLWLAKNKINRVQGLQKLSQLTQLSLQNNRLTKIEGLDALGKLKELYLSENGIQALEGVKCLTSLEILDIASNYIPTIPKDEIQPLSENLVDLWLNRNKIGEVGTQTQDDEEEEDEGARVNPFSVSGVEHLACLKKLDCLYLEHNPVYQDPQYKNKVVAIIPWLKQLDAGSVKSANNPLLQ